jgi:protein-S-isoprenylcysteine O-methyltransferase Ste14
MKKVIAVVTAISMLGAVATSTSANAAGPHGYVAGGAGLSTGGAWALGLGIAAATSLIACSVLVGRTMGREMTRQEALAAAVIPFSCLFWRPAPAKPRR